MTHSITPLVTEAERVLSEAIKHFGLNVKPERLTVTIQSRGRGNAVGWYAPDRWGAIKEGVESNDAPRHEINLSAEHLHDADLADTILHELAHAECHCLNIKDTDKTCKKHNKHFKEMAEKLGLNVLPKDNKVGWGTTELGTGAKAFLERIKFDSTLFSTFRLLPEKKETTGTRMLKLACPGCDYIIRTTKGHITKGCPVCPCGETFVQEAAETEEEA